MRVIAGTHGGQVFEAPKGFKTHPMSEKMRGALFNSLGDLSGKTVWDAFSGSGALALEAASRGAETVVATERDRTAFLVLESNIKKLGFAARVKPIKATCRAWASTNVDKRFDLIFCDPPYNDLQLSTVFALKSYLKPNGLMLLSYPGRDPVPSANGVVVVDNRNYGDAALAYYRVR